MPQPIRILAAALLVTALSAAGISAADRSQTASGTVSRLDAERQTLVVKVGTEEMTFVWNAETRINGVLAPGARVTVRYAPQADGRNLAYQISVGR
jgi:Domain of unknown function (DUF5666)